MKLPLPNRESVELWQQGSTGESRRAAPERGSRIPTQEDLQRQIHLAFRRQLVRYLRKRLAERKQVALKPSLLSKIGAWVTAKFRRPAQRAEIDQLFPTAECRREIVSPQRQGRKSPLPPEVELIIAAWEANHHFYRNLMRR